MKAFVSRAPSGADYLVLENIPKPGPLVAGQVRIAMRAASLNYRDLLMLSRTFGPLENLIPVCDGAGEVIETAPDVWRVKVGDKVALTVNPNWIGGKWTPSPGAGGRGGGLPGVMREEIVVNQDETVLLPEHMTFEEGATLPCAALTAWYALCGGAPLLPGMTVLSQGAGGVSIFALQFAKLFGARVIMTSSSPERCARLKKLGADETIDYNAVPEWHTAVRQLTGGMGADLTIEIGGAKTVDRSLAATCFGGRLALVGLLTGIPNATSSMFASSVEIVPLRIGSRAEFEDMNRAIAFHKLRPVIDSRYTFNQLPEALKHMQSGKHFGKIVIGFE